MYKCTFGFVDLVDSLGRGDELGGDEVLMVGISDILA